MKLKDHISKGNGKVPYYVFNMNSATDCPSKALGLCPHSDICYAMKAERQYPAVLPYRRRQEAYWNVTNAATFSDELIAIQARAKSMPKVLRFSESGDFDSQYDVDKMTAIAKRLKRHGWKVYGYTARVDLDLTNLVKWAAINLSNDSSAIVKVSNRFKAVNVASGDNFLCPGDCRKCNLCLRATGKTIEVIKH